MAERDGISFWQRTALFVLGATMGTVLIVLYVRRKQFMENSRVIPEVDYPPEFVHTAPSAIQLKVPAEIVPVKEAEHSQPAGSQLPLTVKASPAKFIRNKAGAIKITTLPGAICAMTATYSTNRSPSSLDGEAVTAGEDGTYVWKWEIGTSGTYVDIEVKAHKDGHADVTAGLRVKITDQ